jgi:hypothetical protein
MLNPRQGVNGSAAAYAASGFHSVGLLRAHLGPGAAHADAFLGSRKLALPDDA